jgi:rhodanese-related sulfurtransferase
MMQSTRVTIEEVKTRLERGEPFIFIDARNEEAWEDASEILPGAIRVPADDVASHIPEIAHGTSIITYCTCPNEQSSARVADELLNQGYKNAHPLYGGFDAWRQAKLPLETKEQFRKGSQAGS